MNEIVSRKWCEYILKMHPFMNCSAVFPHSLFAAASSPAFLSDYCISIRAVLKGCLHYVMVIHQKKQGYDNAMQISK